MVALGLSFVVFLAVALVVVSVINVSSARRTLLKERIDEYAPGSAGGSSSTFDILKTQRQGVVRPLDQLVEGTTLAENLALEMIQADLPLRPGEYVAVHITMAAILFAGFSFAFGSLLFGLVGVPVSFFAIRFFVQQRQQARLKAFETQLPEAIDLINSSLRSGFGLLQGMETVSRDLARPIKDEFTHVVRNVGMGMQLDDALAGLCRRVPGNDVYLLVTAILVHRTVGGNLSEVLAGIANTVRARIRMRAEVHAITTYPRVSSYLVAALPFFVFTVVFLSNQKYVALLWTTSIGRVMLLIGGTLMVIGLLISRRFAQLDY